MKKLGFFIAAITLVLAGFSQSSRQTIFLKNLDLKLLNQGADQSTNILVTKDLDSISNQNTLIDTSGAIIGKFTIEEQLPNLIAFYNYGTGNGFDIQINGNKVKNALSGANFYADITSVLSMGINTVLLKPKHSLLIADCLRTIKNAQIALLDGMVFLNFEVKKDAYFGGNMLEVKVVNFNDKDLDGKIYARLYTSETMKLLAESNNCAFSRSGKESSIEINFPELKTDLTGQTIIVELSIVDKEKNEELLDQLSLPVIY